MTGEKTVFPPAATPRNTGPPTVQLTGCCTALMSACCRFWRPLTGPWRKTLGSCWPLRAAPPAAKSTLADLLTAIYPDTALFHADDFFLRPEQRTAARYAQPGGNLDRERLESEILIPISRNKAAVYRPFDCRTLSLREPVTVLPGRLNIVEGSYSFHPELARYYDLSVFWTFPRKPSGAGY